MQLYIYMDRQTGRQTDRQTGRQADRQAGRQTDRQADRQTGRQAGRQAGRQTDRWFSRQHLDVRILHLSVFISFYVCDKRSRTCFADFKKKKRALNEC
jgi:hypothetical protein